MKIIHERDILNQNYPFELWMAHEIEYYPHWHEGIELVYLLDGTAKVGVNDKIADLKPKDILFIGKGDTHYFLTDKSTGNMVIIQFNLSLIGNLPLKIPYIKLVDPIINSDKSYDAHRVLEEYVLNIIEEYNQKKALYQLSINARLYDIITYIIRHVDKMECTKADKSRHILQLEHLERVFDYVEQNYEYHISLADVSRVASYSEYYFTRFFKGITGMTFTKFLNGFRVKKAEELLRNQSLSITEVAQQCGFNSIKTFNRVFKEINGCTPSTQRKKAIFEK